MAHFIPADTPKRALRLSFGNGHGSIDLKTGTGDDFGCNSKVGVTFSANGCDWNIVVGRAFIATVLPGSGYRLKHWLTWGF